MDLYMFIFEILVFSAAVIVIYLYWNTSLEETPIVEKKEGFSDVKSSKSRSSSRSSSSNEIIQNISMCPGISKSYVGKNGDSLCCEGNPAGTDCEGKIICTLSSTNSKEHQSCAAYLVDLYRKKGIEFCPRSMPNYFLDPRGKAFCTTSQINNQLNGPQDASALKCNIGENGMSDPQSCEVRLALDKMPCPSPGCQKDAFLPYRGKSVILYANFRDSGQIQHFCYDTNSLISFWRSIFGEEWKSRISHINPDRNIMFCDVAKRYFVDKTIQKKDIDI